MIEEIKWTSSTLPLNNLRFTLTYINNMQNVTPDLTEPHIHSGIEFYVNLIGDVSFLVDNRLYPVQSGDIIISLPNLVHHCVYHNTTRHEHFCLWVDTTENSPLFDFTKRPDFSPRFTFDEHTKAIALHLLAQLRDLDDEGSQNEVLKTTYLLQFLSLFITGSNIAKDTHNETPATFQKILKYFDEHAHSIRSVKEVSDAFFISPATLNRYFRKYVRISPKEFLESKKLSIAKILLTKGRSVTEAGDEAGFFDSSHFIATFKKKFGETPLQYKRHISG